MGAQDQGQGQIKVAVGQVNPGKLPSLRWRHTDPFRLPGEEPGLLAGLKWGLVTCWAMSRRIGSFYRK